MFHVNHMAPQVLSQLIPPLVTPVAECAHMRTFFGVPHLVSPYPAQEPALKRAVDTLEHPPRTILVDSNGERVS